MPQQGHSEKVSKGSGEVKRLQAEVHNKKMRILTAQENFRKSGRARGFQEAWIFAALQKGLVKIVPPRCGW